MDNFKVIEFHRQRDFSKKMNATTEFIKQNFLPLSRSILFIAGPPVLIAGVLNGSFMGQLMGISQMGTFDGAVPFASGNFFLKLIFMFIFFLISGVVTLATANNYIILYGEKRTNKIEVSEVWQRVRETFLMYLGTMIFFALLLIVVCIVMMIPTIALGTISPALVSLGIFVFFFVFIYLMISVSLTFIVRAYEKTGFFEAIVRSYNLVQGKWWSTFGLLFILYMIVMVVSYIPLIPFYTMLFAKSLHTTESGVGAESGGAWEVWTTFFFTLYYLIQTILSTLPNVGIAFQYFNLVERKESKGLMNDIEMLGKPQEADRPEEIF